MWFRMPPGTSGVSVELQEFETEVRDADGLGYFRAPEYLAPKILDLPGFAAFRPPEGLTDLEDLPVKNVHDNAVSDLVSQLSTTKASLADVNERLQIALREVHAKDGEIGRLKVTIGELETKLGERPPTVTINAGVKK